jgi:hypothetical protein
VKKTINTNNNQLKSSNLHPINTATPAMISKAIMRMENTNVASLNMVKFHTSKNSCIL